MPPARLKEDSNACTWFSSIDDWQRLDERNMIVWISRKQAYHVQLSMRLLILARRSPSHSSTTIATGGCAVLAALMAPPSFRENRNPTRGEG